MHGQMYASSHCVSPCICNGQTYPFHSNSERDTARPGAAAEAGAARAEVGAGL